VLLKCRVADGTEFGTCCPVLLEYTLFKLVYSGPLRKNKRVSIFLKPCLKTLNEILRIECDLMNIINRNVNEQNSGCAGVIQAATVIEYKLTLAVSSQLTGICRT
jgi:hypothetical protein